MSDFNNLNAGAIVSLKDDGQWTVTQQGIHSPFPTSAESERLPLDWSYGPVKVTGFVDTNTLDIGAVFVINGITTGPVFGSMKDGVSLNINLFGAQGKIQLYLKNGNEIWANLDVKLSFGGHYTGNYKLASY